MKKALIVASVYGFIESFEINNIKILLSMGYEVHTVASDYDSSRNLKYDTPKLDVLEIKKFSLNMTRNPISQENYHSFRELKKLLQKEKYDLIDCHTPVGGVVGRLASMCVNDKKMKVMYTAHGFHFYQGAPKKNWMFYYPIEKWLSKFTDILITINKEDYDIANQKFKMKNLEYVPGVGIDIDEFKTYDFDREGYRSSLGLTENDIMLLSVGELNTNKNHQIIIKALSKVKLDNVHFYIAGEGIEKNNLIDLAKEKKVENKLHLLGYRKDVKELYKCADIYIHPSLREGLPVALLEAIASKTSVICTDVRGNKDLVKDDKRLFQPYDVENLARLIQLNIQYHIENDIAITHFSRESVTNLMKSIYLTI